MSELNFDAYQYFLTDIGRADIGKTISEFKTKYGASWLIQFKKEFPDLVIIVDLVANYNANDAFLKFKEYVSEQLDADFSKQKNTAKGFWDLAGITAKEFAMRGAAMSAIEKNKANLFLLHQFLRDEIDKPRF